MSFIELRFSRDSSSIEGMGVSLYKWCGTRIGLSNIRDNVLFKAFYTKLLENKHHQTIAVSVSLTV